MGAAAGPSTRTLSRRVGGEPAAQRICRMSAASFQRLSLHNHVGQQRSMAGRRIHWRFCSSGVTKPKNRGSPHIGWRSVEGGTSAPVRGREVLRGRRGPTPGSGAERHAPRHETVGQTEGEVRADYADQGDAVDVVALGDHLRAHQQIDFARVEASSADAHVALRPRTVSRSTCRMRASGE